MSFTAVVENGTIKLPPGVELADGAKVRVEPLPHAGESAAGSCFAEEFREFIGCVSQGPEDAADNLDHYLYGTPKRVP